jgi:hypothetical protein
MKTYALKVISLLLVAGIIAGLYSCYPDKSASLSDLDVILTNYDSTYSFSDIHTYIMPDTIIPLNDPNDPGNNVTINYQSEQFILQQLATEFHKLGYTRLTDTLSDKPDVAVLCSAITTTHAASYYTDWYYYWGYYPYWPPYWGGGLYYPWGTGTYSYEVGTLVVQMIDMKSPQIGQDTLRVVWIGAINGVMQNAQTNTRITNDISQLFLQSPYL